MKEMHPNLRDNRNLIMIAGVVIQLCAGIIYMWSIFKSPVVSHLNWDSGSATMVSSAMLVSFVFGMILGGRLQSKYGPTKSGVFGSLLMSVGILLSAFVTSEFPALLYLTYSIMGGLGVGIVYTCTTATVQKWFFDKRGFATGVMVGAFGFSLVIFSPLANYLLGTFGVPFTFEVFGISFMAICTIASLFLVSPPDDYAVEQKKKMVVVSKAQKQYTVREMVARRSFYFIVLSMFFVLPAFFILNPQIKTLGIERGLSEDLAVAAVMITGAASAFGRLGITWLSDRIGRIGALYLIIALTAAGIVAMIFAQGSLFLVCIAVIAFGFGGAAGVYITVTADHFGTMNNGTNYGIVSLGFCASALIFQFLSTMVSAEQSFIVAGVTCAASFICVLLLVREKGDQPTQEQGTEGAQCQV